MSTQEKLEYMVRSTILDRPRRLVIDPEFIEFDDHELVSEPPTRFPKAEIDASKYGVNPIRGYQFRIGRIYCIDVRDSSGGIIKIRLKSLYGVRRKLLQEKYLAIVNALYRSYFHDIMREHFRQFQEEQKVDLLGVQLNSQGVWFDEKTRRIPWEFLGSKRYWHYYTLFPKRQLSETLS